MKLEKRGKRGLPGYDSLGQIAYGTHWTYGAPETRPQERAEDHRGPTNCPAEKSAEIVFGVRGPEKKHYQQYEEKWSGRTLENCREKRALKS